MEADPVPDEGSGARPRRPEAVCALDTPAARTLADLAAVHDDLQYVLLCCEQLVTTICGPATAPLRLEQHSALVEALWTAALVGYRRCFGTGVLTDEDVAGLELEGRVAEFHDGLTELRDHYVSVLVNPREDVSVGLVLGEDGTPQGVAVTSAPFPTIDDTMVRTLGRLTYALRAVVEQRMREAQQEVLAAGLALTPAQLADLPRVLVEN